MNQYVSCMFVLALSGLINAKNSIYFHRLMLVPAGRLTSNFSAIFTDITGVKILNFHLCFCSFIIFMFHQKPNKHHSSHKTKCNKVHIKINNMKSIIKSNSTGLITSQHITPLMGYYIMDWVFSFCWIILKNFSQYCSSY